MTPSDVACRELFKSGLKSCFGAPYDELAQNGSYDPYGHVRVNSSWKVIRSGNVPESTFSRRFANFWGCPRVILPRISTPGPSTTLPQPSRRYPTHLGPILTSQLLLEGDLGPKTCQNRLFRAILDPPEKRIHCCFHKLP